MPCAYNFVKFKKNMQFFKKIDTVKFKALLTLVHGIGLVSYSTNNHNNLAILEMVN